MDVGRVSGDWGKKDGLAVCVVIPFPLLPEGTVAGGGMDSRGKVVVLAVVSLRGSCAANNVSGVQVLAASWSGRMTTCAGISRVPSAKALLDLMICNICLIGFIPCSCRL